MKISTKVLALGAVMGLMAAPAYAVPNSTDNPGTAYQPAGTPNGTNNPGTAYQPAGTPNDTNNPGTTSQPSGSQQRQAVGPNASLPAKARAYGFRCKTQSRKRADAAPGTKGTPFSQCVTAMAKLATGRSSNPRSACVALSKKRADAAPGTRGTPFSQCVVQGAKLLRAQNAQN